MISLKKELEAIKNSAKGESSVDSQAIINSINDLYLKLNKSINPLRDSSPVPGFPYPQIKYRYLTNDKEPTHRF